MISSVRLTNIANDCMYYESNINLSGESDSPSTYIAN